MYCCLELKELFCYSCLDVNVLESDRQPESHAPSFYDVQVDVFFAGVAPPSCKSPLLEKCSADTCFTIHTNLTGIRKYTNLHVCTGSCHYHLTIVVLYSFNFFFHLKLVSLAQFSQLIGKEGGGGN